MHEKLKPSSASNSPTGFEPEADDIDNSNSFAIIKY